MIRTLLHTNRPGVDWFTDGTARTEALRDGLFAIAMKVLVLDLRAPSQSDGRLLHALVE